MSKIDYLNNAKLYFKDKYDLFESKLVIPYESNYLIINKNKNIDNSFFDLKVIQDKKYLNTFKYELINNVNSIGKSKDYELGLIYPQDYSSSVVSQIKDFKDIHYVLDLCSAPGGKTIGIANNISKESLIVANDVNYTRVKELTSNIERLGLNNIVVTNKKIEDFNIYEGLFDLVIIDAPCSGEGMVRKYESIYDSYNESNIDELSVIQKSIIDTGYKCLKSGGYLIYSTCTYSFKEDEENVEYILNKFKDLNLIKLDNFDNNVSTIEGTLKYSFINDCEGQFISLFKKEGNLDNDFNLKYLKEIKNPIVDKFIKDNLNIDKYYLYENNNRFFISFNKLYDFKNNTLRNGIYIGDLDNKVFKPAHNMYRSNELFSLFKYKYELNDSLYEDFVSGKELIVDDKLENKYYCLTYHNFSIGFGKYSNNRITNKYPKGIRKIV